MSTDASATTVFRNGYRLQSITYPGPATRRVTYYDYGDSDSGTNIDDRLSRVKMIYETNTGGTQLTEYAHNGTGRLVEADYPAPKVKLDHYQVNGPRDFRR